MQNRILPNRIKQKKRMKEELKGEEKKERVKKKKKNISHDRIMTQRKQLYQKQRIKDLPNTDNEKYHGKADETKSCNQNNSKNQT